MKIKNHHEQKPESSACVLYGYIGEGIDRNDGKAADCPVLGWCGIICTTTGIPRHMSICRLFASSIQELLEERKKYNRVNSLE